MRSNIALPMALVQHMSGSTVSACFHRSRLLPSPRRGLLPSISRRVTMAATSVLADVPTFPTQLQSLGKLPGPHYVIFSADLNPETQLPWCGDCVRALPAVKSAVSSSGWSLLEVRVGPRPTWKDPAHPFRVDPAIKLTGIPTLFHCAQGEDGQMALGERAGPELEAAPGPKEAEEVAAAFIKRTSGR